MSNATDDFNEQLAELRERLEGMREHIVQLRIDMQPATKAIEDFRASLDTSEFRELTESIQNAAVRIDAWLKR